MIMRHTIISSPSDFVFNEMFQRKNVDKKMEETGKRWIRVKYKQQDKNMWDLKCYRDYSFSINEKLFMK